MGSEAARSVRSVGFVIGATVKTYRIEYFCREEWVPGNLVQMNPAHLNRYLEFLAGERPLVGFLKVNGHPTFKRLVQRDKKKCLPTRVRAANPDWSQEDGYYLFDGINVEFVNLADSGRFRAPRELS